MAAAKFSYANQRGLPRFCDAGDEPTWGHAAAAAATTSGKKRGAGDDEDTEREDDVMDMQPPPLASRAVRAAPRRMMARGGTQSMPACAFAFAGSAPVPATTPLPTQDLIRPVAGGAPPPGTEPDFGDLFNEDF